MQPSVSAARTVKADKRLNNLRPFPKGVSGNPGGRPKGSVSLAATLKRLLRAPDAESIMAAVIDSAKSGDLAAVKLLLDRIDGPLAGPYAVVSAQAGVHLPIEPQTQITVMENNENRPFSGLSKQRLKEIIALAPEVAPAATLLPAPANISPVAPVAPAPEPTPEPVSAPELPEQPQEPKPAAPAPDPPGLKRNKDFILDPFKVQEDPEPARLGGVMTAEEFLR